MALENIYENGKEEPCKAHHPNVYGGLLEALGSEDAAVEQQDRKFDDGYRKRVSNNASHQKLGLFSIMFKWSLELSVPYLEEPGELLDGKCLSR